MKGVLSEGHGQLTGLQSAIPDRQKIIPGSFLVGEQGPVRVEHILNSAFGSVRDSRLSFQLKQNSRGIADKNRRGSFLQRQLAQIQVFGVQATILSIGIHRFGNIRKVRRCDPWMPPSFDQRWENVHRSIHIKNGDHGYKYPVVVALI
jgi:hypothetical protein